MVLLVLVEDKVGLDLGAGLEQIALHFGVAVENNHFKTTGELLAEQLVQSGMSSTVVQTFIGNISWDSLVSWTHVVEHVFVAVEVR